MDVLYARAASVGMRLMRRMHARRRVAGSALSAA